MAYFMKKPFRSLVVLVAVFSLTGTACAFPKFFWNRDKDVEEEAPEKKRPEKIEYPGGTPTFLDTLNRGKEVFLKKEDIASAVHPTPSGLDQQSMKAPSIDGFRIQCLASGSIESIRERKKEVERQVAFPAYIAYDEPYYKLHLGDFLDKPNAEKALQEVKRAGFPDAWIISAKVNGKQ